MKATGRISYEILSLLLVPFALFPACGAGEAERLEDTSQFHLELAYGEWGAGRVPQAIEEAQVALAIDPENEEAHYLLGFIFSGREMYSEAVQHYRQALLLRPGWSEVQNNLGVVYLQLERWDEAIELFEGLTEIPAYQTPGHAYNNLGWARYNLNQYSEALSDFDMAIFLQPDLCLAYNNKGMTQMALERLDDAVESFEAAVRKCANYAEPRYWLGRMRQDQGDLAEARVLFTECAELVPEAPLGRRCREYMVHD